MSICIKNTSKIVSIKGFTKNFRIQVKVQMKSWIIFQNLENIAQLWEKNALIFAICGLHFSCGFKSFQEKKTEMLPCRAFLSYSLDKMYIEVP